MEGELWSLYFSRFKALWIRFNNKLYQLYMKKISFPITRILPQYWSYIKCGKQERSYKRKHVLFVLFILCSALTNIKVLYMSLESTMTPWIISNFHSQTRYGHGHVYLNVFLLSPSLHKSICCFSTAEGWPWSWRVWRKGHCGPVWVENDLNIYLKKGKKWPAP